MSVSIGIDIGGTKCALSVGACSTDAVKILHREEFPTKGLGWQEVLEEFGKRIDTLIAAQPESAPYRIGGIGVSCGGPLDSKRGVIMSPPNLPGWDNVPVVKFFADRFGVPVHLQNDANACAYAEWKFGAGRGTKNMVFMTFGTGLGAGIIIDGKGNVQIALDRADAQYDCSEEAVFTITFKSGETPLPQGKVSWTLDNYGAHVFAKGTVDLAKTNSFVVKGTMAYPGFLRVTVRDDRGKQLRAYSAAYEPKRIRTAVPRPADFDAFWENAIAKLEKEVPLDPQVEQVPGWPRKGVNLQRVSFATVGGKRVYGVLASPTDATKGPYPVRIQFPGAGPGLVMKRCHVDSDHVTLYMNAHYFPVPETDEDAKAPYAAQEAAWRKIHGPNRARAYPVGGLTVSREAAHYYGIILGVNRAIDWVARRTDIDPKRFFYTGASQGGGFGLILTALNKHITRAYAGVPAMADMLGCKADGRQSGWPRILEYETQTDPVRLAKIEENVRYFDAAFFAARITVPIRLSVGYADESCAPHAVLAAYNAIPSKDKKLYHGIGGLHGSRNAPGEEVDKWLEGK